MSRKLLLTCAVTGGAPFNPKHPSMPITPKQIAAACVEAARAGASIAHVHVRDPETGVGNREPALFKEVVDRVRQSGTDIVLNLTCGMGAYYIPDPKNEARGLPESDVAPVPERMIHLEENMPEMATLDVTTGNQVEGTLEYVYLNTTRSMRQMAKRFQELGVKPELEVFSAGDILFANQLVDEGLIDGAPMIQMVLGVKWGAPATIETLLYQRGLFRPGTIWGAFGIGRDQMPMVAQTALLGGNIRVGLEDNLYMSRGVFATNGGLVERARKIVETAGIDATIATPAEAREILALRTP